MSLDYAAGLSDYNDLGVCGLDEIHDKIEVVKEKVKILADLLKSFKGSCVVHVGAGLSTAAGIPDFRGKRGVWTKKLQKETKIKSPVETDLVVKNERNQFESNDDDDDDSEVELKSFDETIPTLSHYVLGVLCRKDYVSHIISQNVDGLFLKSNLPRNYISELHGNFYLDECTVCRSRFIRSTASKSMRLQKSNIKCPVNDKFPKLKPCRGHLRDTILDWESPIPYNELRRAQIEAKRNKLHICIGTSMQLKPSKNLVCDPTRNKRFKLVVINLQPTQLDTKANLVINYFADEVLKQLADQLDLDIPQYNAAQDPTKNPDLNGSLWEKVKYIRPSLHHCCTIAHGK